MVECCSPNPVNLVGGCYVWCELPKSSVFVVDGKPDTNFTRCLRAKGWTGQDGPLFSDLRISGAHPRAYVSLRGVGFWLVMSSGLFLALV